MHHELNDAGVPSARFGWASVQLDGASQGARQNRSVVHRQLAALPPATPARVDLGALAVGLMTAAPVSEPTATALASVARTIVERGGSVLIPESDPLLGNPTFRLGALGSIVPHATLAYGQPLNRVRLPCHRQAKRIIGSRTSPASAPAADTSTSLLLANTPGRATHAACRPGSRILTTRGPLPPRTSICSSPATPPGTRRRWQRSSSPSPNAPAHPSPTPKVSWISSSRAASWESPRSKMKRGHVGDPNLGRINRGPIPTYVPT